MRSASCLVICWVTTGESLSWPTSLRSSRLDDRCSLTIGQSRKCIITNNSIKKHYTSWTPVPKTRRAADTRLLRDRSCHPEERGGPWSISDTSLGSDLYQSFPQDPICRNMALWCMILTGPGLKSRCTFITIMILQTQRRADVSLLAVSVSLNVICKIVDGTILTK